MRDESCWLFGLKWSTSDPGVMREVLLHNLGVELRKRRASSQPALSICREELACFLFNVPSVHQFQLSWGKQKCMLLFHIC